MSEHREQSSARAGSHRFVPQRRSTLVEGTADIAQILSQSSPVLPSHESPQRSPSVSPAPTLAPSAPFLPARPSSSEGSPALSKSTPLAPDASAKQVLPRATTETSLKRPSPPSSQSPSPSSRKDDPVIKALIAERDQARREAEEANKELEVARRRAREREESAEQEIRLLRDAKEYSAKQLKALVSPLASQKESLREEVERLVAKVEFMTREREVLKAQIAALKQKAAHLESAKHLVERELTVLRGVVSRGDSDLDALKLEVAEVSGALRSSFKEQKAAAEREAADQEMQEQRSAAEDEEKCIASADEKLAAAEQQLEQLLEEETEGPEVGEAARQQWIARYQDLKDHGLDPFAEQYCFDEPDSVSNIAWMEPGAVSLANPSGFSLPIGSAPPASGEPRRDIRAATFDKLIEKLTSATAVANPDFVTHFLLTYRTFTTPEELFRKLVTRYRISDAVASEEQQEFVRFRVIAVIQAWVERLPKDFADQEQKTRVYLFAHAILKNRTFAKTIVKLVSHLPLPPPKLKLEETVARSLPEIHESMSIIQLPAVEIARQLCLLDLEAFCRIQCGELLVPKNWSAKPVVPAVNVIAMVRRFNRVSSQ